MDMFFLIYSPFNERGKEKRKNYCLTGSSDHTAHCPDSPESSPVKRMTTGRVGQKPTHHKTYNPT
jgi:hypothetical protein